MRRLEAYAWPGNVRESAERDRAAVRSHVLSPVLLSLAGAADPATREVALATVRAVFGS